MTSDERAAAVPSTGRRRHVHHLIRHPSTPLVAFTIAAAVVLVGTFAPWLHSGSTARSSYAVLGLMSRLGIADDDLLLTLVKWWPLVPLMVTSAVVSAWWGWTRVAFAAALVSAASAGGVGIAVAVATRGTVVDVGHGPWICAAGGVAMVMCAGWMALTSATGPAVPARDAAPLADRS